MWALKPFTYLFRTYWSAQQPIEVLCETKPSFRLPENFTFHQIRVPPTGKWPKEKWTNGFIPYLSQLQTDYLIIFLEDYWLNRTADVVGIGTLLDYMKLNRNILRVDLTQDRLYATGPQYPINDPDYGHWGHYDLINRKGEQYEMSLQVGIWNRKLLLDVLKDDWSPWQVELEGTNIVNEKDDMIVLGTRQNPVRYTNGLKNEATNVNLKDIPEEHLKVIKQWIPKSRQGE
jgi:hypothetical protein